MIEKDQVANARSNNECQSGYFKSEKINHIIKHCPLWEIEWKKERDETELKLKEKYDLMMKETFSMVAA